MEITKPERATFEESEFTGSFESAELEVESRLALLDAMEKAVNAFLSSNERLN